MQWLLKILGWKVTTDLIQDNIFNRIWRSIQKKYTKWLAWTVIWNGIPALGREFILLPNGDRWNRVYSFFPLGNWHKQKGLKRSSLPLHVFSFIHLSGYSVFLKVLSKNYRYAIWLHTSYGFIGHMKYHGSCLEVNWQAVQLNKNRCNMIPFPWSSQKVESHILY